MKKLLNVLALFLLITGVSATSTGYLVRVFPDNYRTAMHQFSAIDHLDIAGASSRQGWIDLLVSREQLDRIEQTYPIEIRRTPEDFLQERVDPNYKTPDEIATLMQQFHTTYPAITELVDIGTTEQGRSIWALRISDNPAVTEDEPVVIFNGQHHAREVMACEVPLDTIEYLCQNYPTNPDVQHWVDSFEIWIIPMVNLDGVNYMWTSYDMWRKDRHSPPPGSSEYGIDPNRNYPTFWGECDGSSGYPGDDDYRGQSPGESGCVTRMMDFFDGKRAVFDISYHSYSELVIYSYGCDGSTTPDHEAMANIGASMAGLIQRDDGGMGYGSGTSWQTLYATDGGDTDWHYAANGTFAYVIELNADDFQPPWSYRNPTVQHLRPAWQYLLNRIDGSAVSGHVRDACTGEIVSGAVVAVQEIPLTSTETPRTTDTFGSFLRLLLPGTYTLQISAPGYVTATVPVTIGATREDLDIEILPTGALGLTITDITIDDPSGDQDGIMDPGETVAIRMTLRASGNLTNVTASIASTDPNIAILTATAAFGNIPDGATAESQSPHFVVAVNPSCPNDYPVAFSVSLSASQELCADTGTFTSTVTSYVYQCPLYSEDLTANPGYEIVNHGATTGWAYGHPTTGPGNGHTGANCYGTNLSGNYGNNINVELISTAFDCSVVSDVELRYWRWLQNELNYDTAYVDVSTNHTTWTTVWSGYASDSAWTQKTYDISSVADGQPEVYVRWRLTSDSYLVYPGFFVDDIEICGKSLPDQTPTPAPTWTTGPTFTPTVLPSSTPVPPTATPTVGPGEPTNTPVPATATPSTPPPCEQLGVTLVMPSDLFHPGDTCFCNVFVCNPGPDTYTAVPLFVILDVYGSYYFWPSFSEYDVRTIDLNVGVMELEVLPQFSWPEGAGSAENIAFYSAMTDEGISTLFGAMSEIRFGWTE